MMIREIVTLNRPKSSPFVPIIIKNCIKCPSTSQVLNTKIQAIFSRQSLIRNKVALTISFAFFIFFGSGSLAFAEPIISFNHPFYYGGGFYPVIITIDDSSNPVFTSSDSGIQKIMATVSSSVEEKQIVLTETGVTSGIFSTKLGYSEIDYEFHVGDSITIVQPDPSLNSEPGAIDTIGTGAIVGTFDPSFNLKEIIDPIVLTETGTNTGIFSKDLSLVDSTTTDSQLTVEPGDLFVYQYGDFYRIGIILPNPNDNVNLIQIKQDDCDADLVDELTVSYLDVSSSVDIHKSNSATLCGSGGGSGGGGALVRPGLVLNFIASLLGGGSNPMAPPTLGLDQNYKRVVDDGFSFNGNSIDAEKYYTPYPLITTQVGEINTIKLKIYEDRGPENIAHVGLSYGLGKGETFTQGRATIEFDRSFDGKESVTLFDPNHVLGEVNVTTSIIQCSEENSANCLEVTFDHIFRESLDYNMLATNIWDYQRNGWQNYFNHGIEILGDSMNPPDEYSGIFHGKIYHLTEVEKNIAVDDEGNYWTFNKIWNRNFIKTTNDDKNILNQEKLDAIKQLGFHHSIGEEVFGYDRNDLRFSSIKSSEQDKAQNILNELCSKCQIESFEEIGDVFSYDMPTRYSKLNDPETRKQIDLENQKAEDYLKNYLEHLYRSRTND